MAKIEQHEKMKKLVNSKAIIPGIIKEVDGAKVYEPISIELYNEMMQKGEVEEIAYNTLSMGRGIFTVGEEGEIINYKGVDSNLEDKDNIATGKIEATIYNISEILKNERQIHGITVTLFPNQLPEIRVRGASQLQNLVNEKQKLDEAQQKNKKDLIKFPKITEVKPFSSEFCDRMGLPKVEEMPQEFIKKLELENKEKMEETRWKYRKLCL